MKPTVPRAEPSTSRAYAAPTAAFRPPIARTPITRPPIARQLCKRRTTQAPLSTIRFEPVARPTLSRGSTHAPPAQTARPDRAQEHIRLRSPPAAPLARVRPAPAQRGRCTRSCSCATRRMALQIDIYRVEHGTGYSVPCISLLNRRGGAPRMMRWVCQRHMEIL